MAGNTEIIAILSSGVSFTRLLRPYLLAAVLLLLGLSMLEKDEIFSRVAAKLRQLQTKHYLKLFSS